MKKDKIKILAIGDIHGDVNLAKKLAKRTKNEKIDLVIIAGDLTLAEISIKNLLGHFTKENKPVLIIPGNHETLATTNTLTEMYSNVKNIHGYSFSKNNLGIFGAGGADIGIQISTEKEIFSLLERGHKKIKNLEKKIMVTHMHPSGSKAEFSGFPGSKSVKKAIEKFNPQILISAHIHEAGGLIEKMGKTQIINVSRTSAVIEI